MAALRISRADRGRVIRGRRGAAIIGVKKGRANPCHIIEAFISMTLLCDSAQQQVPAAMPPTVCESGEPSSGSLLLDDPVCCDIPGWTDDQGNNCATFVEQGWCCAAGVNEGCNAAFLLPGGVDADHGCCRSCAVAMAGCADDDDRMRASSGYTCGEIRAGSACSQVSDLGHCGCSCPTAPPTVCESGEPSSGSLLLDDPMCCDIPGWTDDQGNNCATFVEQGWCCAAGVNEGCNSNPAFLLPGGVDADHGCCRSCAELVCDALVPTCADGLKNGDEILTDCGPSCRECRPGCTEPSAMNFDPVAEDDDGTCIFDFVPCLDDRASTYDPRASANYFNPAIGSACTYTCDDVVRAIVPLVGLAMGDKKFLAPETCHDQTAQCVPQEHEDAIRLDSRTPQCFINDLRGFEEAATRIQGPLEPEPFLPIVCAKYPNPRLGCSANGTLSSSVFVVTYADDTPVADRQWIGPNPNLRTLKVQGTALILHGTPSHPIFNGRFQVDGVSSAAFLAVRYVRFSGYHTCARNAGEYGWGAAIETSGRSVVQLISSRFDNLLADGHGGAVVVRTSCNVFLYVVDSIFHACRTGYTGGAIATIGDESECLLGDNRPRLVIVNSVFEDNVAFDTEQTDCGTGSCDVCHNIGNNGKGGALATQFAVVAIYGSHFENNVADSDSISGQSHFLLSGDAIHAAHSDLTIVETEFASFDDYATETLWDRAANNGAGGLVRRHSDVTGCATGALRQTVRLEASKVASCGAHPCDPGFRCSYSTSDDEAFIWCRPCPKGTFGSDGLVCEVCGPYQRPNVDTGATGCVCAPGFLGPHCEYCPRGQQVDRESQSCQLCPMGKAGDGRAPCEICLDNMVPSADHSSCLVCPAGRQASLTHDHCDECPPGKATASNSRGLCERCPPGEIPAGDRSMCVCKPGYFNRNDMCVLCADIFPPGSYECPGGNKSTAFALPGVGWWMDTSRSVEGRVYRCKRKENCPGWSAGGTCTHVECCTANHTGPLCATCKSPADYIKIDGRCVFCPATRWSYVVITWLVYTLLGLYLERKSRQLDDYKDGSTLSIITFYIQSVVIFSSHQLYGIGNLLNFNINAVSDENPVCKTPMSPYLSLFVGGLVVPAYMGVVSWAVSNRNVREQQSHIEDLSASLSTALYLESPGGPQLEGVNPSISSGSVSKVTKKRTAKRIVKKRRHRAVLEIAMFSYMGVTKKCLSVLLCRDVGDKKLLYLDLSQTCYDSQHTLAIGLAVLGLVGLTLGLPALIVLKAHTISKTGQKHAELTTFSRVTTLFNADCQWWMAWLMFRRAVIVAAFFYGKIAAIEGHSVDWRALPFFVLAVSGLLQVWYMPFKLPGDNRLESLSLLMLMVIIYIDEADNSSEQTFEAFVVLCANAAVFVGIFIQDTPLTAKAKGAATKIKECIMNPHETKQAALQRSSATKETASIKCTTMKHAATRACSKHCSSCYQHEPDELNEASFDMAGSTGDLATSMELDGGLVLEGVRTTSTADDSQ